MCLTFSERHHPPPAAPSSPQQRVENVRAELRGTALTMANLGKKSKGKNKKKKKNDTMKSSGDKALQDKIKQMEEGDYQKRLAVQQKKLLKVCTQLQTVRSCAHFTAFGGVANNRNDLHRNKNTQRGTA